MDELLASLTCAELQLLSYFDLSKQAHSFGQPQNVGAARSLVRRRLLWATRESSREVFYLTAQGEGLLPAARDLWRSLATLEGSGWFL